MENEISAELENEIREAWNKDDMCKHDEVAWKRALSQGEFYGEVRYRKGFLSGHASGLRKGQDAEEINSIRKDQEIASLTLALADTKEKLDKLQDAFIDLLWAAEHANDKNLNPHVTEARQVLSILTDSKK